MATRQELERQFLQYYPQGNPGMLQDQELAQYVLSRQAQPSVTQASQLPSLRPDILAAFPGFMTPGTPAVGLTPSAPMTSNRPAFGTAPTAYDTGARAPALSTNLGANGSFGASGALGGRTGVPTIRTPGVQQFGMATNGERTNYDQDLRNWPTGTPDVRSYAGQPNVFEREGGAGAGNRGDIGGGGVPNWTWNPGAPNPTTPGSIRPTGPATNTGIPYNPNLGVETNAANPFVNEGGGLNFGTTAGMYNALISTLFPNYQNTMANTYEGQNQLMRYLFQNYPTELQSQILGGMSGLGGAGSNLLASGMSGLESFIPTMQGNVNYINQYGLPGSQQLQGEQANLGNLASALLGNTAMDYTNYGLPQFYSQILQQGLPGQQQIENMVTSGGLSPEYVQAMRETVLQPTQEALAGQLNRQGGGVASPQSGLFQEMQRRNERDFNNALIASGYQNMLGAFNASSQAIAPYTSQMTGLTSDLLSQGLNRYNVGSTQGLNALNTIAGLAYQPLTTGANLLSTATGQGQNYLQNYLQQMLSGLGQGQNYALGMGGQLGGLTSDMLQAYLQNLAITQNAEQARNQAIGAAFGSVMGAVGGGLGGFGSTGSLTGPTMP